MQPHPSHTYMGWALQSWHKAASLDRANLLPFHRGRLSKFRPQLGKPGIPTRRWWLSSTMMVLKDAARAPSFLTISKLTISTLAR